MIDGWTAQLKSCHCRSQAQAKEECFWVRPATYPKKKEKHSAHIAEGTVSETGRINTKTIYDKDKTKLEI